MKVMKKYSKPQIEVITIPSPVILAGSGEKGTTLYGSDKFDSSSEALSRQGFFGEDDEEYE